jgi:hypothetical protein
MGLSYNEFQFKFSSSSYSLHYTDMIPALKNCHFLGSTMLQKDMLVDVNSIVLAIGSTTE